MLTPYIGITDFTNFDQVLVMLRTLKTFKPKEMQRRLHVGVMMSYKTLNDIPSKWSNVFPPKEKIADIFFSEDAYNCLHYADYDRVDTDLIEALSKAIGYGGNHIDALQLDMMWPSPSKIVSAIHQTEIKKEIQIILQIGKQALEHVDNEPLFLVEKLKEYKGAIHRVLLDKSMGKGLGMDAQGLIPFVQAIKENFPELGIGVAGGLGPETMHLVEPLVKEFPDLSIDAQGRLRPSGNAMDPIDWNMAWKYLVEALKLFK